jgi:hypothetical protein
LAFQSPPNGTTFNDPLRVRAVFVLDNLSKQIRECLQRAEDFACKAAAETDPKLKNEFLDMERRWLYLARSYELTQQLGDFSDETKRKADTP